MVDDYLISKASRGCRVRQCRVLYVQQWMYSLSLTNFNELGCHYPPISRYRSRGCSSGSCRRCKMPLQSSVVQSAIFAAIDVLSLIPNFNELGCWLWRNASALRALEQTRTILWCTHNLSDHVRSSSMRLFLIVCVSRMVHTWRTLVHSACLFVNVCKVWTRLKGSSYNENEHNLFYRELDAEYFFQQFFQKEQYFRRKLWKTVLGTHWPFLREGTRLA